jgi:protein tyrosine phosphatase (PTP) superfamily phosphohydrolase (DUF442 family)
MGTTVIVVAVVAVAAVWATWWAFGATYHLDCFANGLYRDGNRSMRLFANGVRRNNYRTVVALVDDREIAREPFVSEVEFCRERGIDLVRIPVALGGWPTSAQVAEFLRLARDPQRRPLLVHCAQGVRRTGMMVAAYQETVMEFDKPRAKSSILRFGHSQRSIGDIERFIDVYDARSMTVTEALPMSQE